MKYNSLNGGKQLSKLYKENLEQNAQLDHKLFLQGEAIVQQPPIYKNSMAMVDALRPEEPVFCLRPHEIQHRARDFVQHFPGKTYYAVKCNDNPLVLKALHDSGVVSENLGSQFRDSICGFHFGERIPSSPYKVGGSRFRKECDLLCPLIPTQGGPGTRKAISGIPSPALKNLESWHARSMVFGWRTSSSIGSKARPGQYSSRFPINDAFGPRAVVFGRTETTLL